MPPNIRGCLEFVTTATAVGMIIAAPTPCSTRAAIRIDDVGANPQTSDVAPNSSTPSRSTERRPTMSALRAAGINSAPRAIMYPLSNHCRSVAVLSKSSAIIGSARAREKKSNWMRNIAAATGR